MSKKITELPAAVTVLTTDILPIVNLTDTTTRKATVAQILALVATLVPGGITGDIQAKNGAALAGITPTAAGKVLVATGANASAFGPLDLANANARTGLLPVANISPSVTNGQVLTTVAGASAWATPTTGAVPAGSTGDVQTNAGGGLFGALTPTTTDKVLRATSATTAAFGALNLAAAAAVTGLLPLANMAAPTGTGPAKISSGVWVTAATAINLANADVTGTLGIGNGGTGASSLASGYIKSNGTVLSSQAVPIPIADGGTNRTTIAGAANEVVSVDGAATGYTTGSNVTVGTSFIRIGTGVGTPTIGGIRFAYNATDTLIAVKDSGGGDEAILSRISADYIQLGPALASAMNLDLRGSSMNIFANGTLTLYGGGVQSISTNGVNIKAAQPVSGMSAASVPFQWEEAVVAFGASGVDQSATASQYECPSIIITGSSAATGMNLLMPNKTGAYFIVKNNSSSPKTISRVSGAGVVISSSTKSNVVIQRSSVTEYEATYIP